MSNEMARTAKDMRVLWIAHDVIEAFYPFVTTGSPSRGGSWIDPLLQALSVNSGTKFGFAAPVINGVFEERECNNISCYTIPITKGENKKSMTIDLAERYQKIISAFNPDLIHVHGTENNFGQIAKYVAGIPVICSIQGIITSYLPYLVMSGESFQYRKYRSIKNCLGRGGVEGRIRDYKRYTRIECDIFSNVHNYFGRTDWDEAHVASLSPGSNYYKGEELLRKPFMDDFHGAWSVSKMIPFSIFISSGAYSIKGLHVLLDAAKILLERYPGLQITCPLASGAFSSPLKRVLIGEDYANCIYSKVQENGLDGHFRFLGRLSAVEMAQHFAKSHVFVMPSFVENSPNSLGEAMMVGCPCVAAAAGGIASIVETDESALLFPVGDASMLARQLHRLFNSPALATAISKNAQAIAERRHSVLGAVQQYSEAYMSILSGAQS